MSKMMTLQERLKTIVDELKRQDVLNKSDTMVTSTKTLTLLYSSIWDREMNG